MGKLPGSASYLTSTAQRREGEREGKEKETDREREGGWAMEEGGEREAVCRGERQG